MASVHRIATYDAFISYSHVADKRLAPAIQAGLRGFARPWYRAIGMRVFRDETNLSVSPALWTSIEQALENSGSFILLASPAAAASRWVRRELEFWLAHRDRQTLLIALTDGNIQWDVETGDFDWERTDALPREFSRVFAEEPNHADFTWAHNDTDFSLRNPRFAIGVARLVSAIRGRPLGELIGDDVRQRRRTKTAITAAFVAIAAAAGIAGWQWQIAEMRRQLAVSRQLANQSLNQLDQQPDLALLLSVEAARVANTVDAKGSLLTALRHQPALVGYLRGHDGEVLAAAIGPDGRLAISGDDRGRIVFWDLEGGNQIPPAIEQQHRIAGLAISPDGRILASADNSGKVMLWDVQTHLPAGKPLDGHSGSVNSVAFSPDGRLLASGGSGDVVIVWDMQQRSELARVAAVRLRPIFSVAFSPDGKLLAAGGLGGTRLMDVRRLAWKGPFLMGHTQAVSAVAFAPKGGTLATGSFDGTIVLHDLVTGKEIGSALSEHATLVQSIAFSADGRFILSGDSAGMVLRWDAGTRKRMGTPWRASRGVSHISVSSNNRNVVTANYDGTLAVWDLGREESLAVPLPETHKGANSIAFSPDSRALVSGGMEGAVKVWDVSARQVVWSLQGVHEAAVHEVAFSPGGAWFAVKYSRNVVVFDAVRRVPAAHQPTSQNAISNLQFTGDGKALFLGTPAGVVLWDMEHGTESAQGHLPQNAAVHNLAYSAIRDTIAVSSRDGLISLLDAHNLKPMDGPPMAESTSVINMVFSPNGQVLASAHDDGAIVLWSVPDRKLIWRAANAHGQEALSLALSPDGAILASGGADGTIMLWDVTSGQAIGQPLPAHKDGVDAVVFAPNGLLASAGRDDRIRLWEIGVKAWSMHVCNIVARDLTDIELRRYLEGEHHTATCSGPTRDPQISNNPAMRLFY